MQEPQSKQIGIPGVRARRLGNQKVKENDGRYTFMVIRIRIGMFDRTGVTKPMMASLSKLP